MKNAFFSGREFIVKTTVPGRTDTEAGDVLMRGLVQQARDVTDDERVCGELTIEANACLDADSRCGTLWGTFVLENPAGKWLAAWIGRKTAGGVTIYATGYGIRAYQGLLANWTYTRLGQDPDAPVDIQGFIVKTSPA